MKGAYYCSVRFINFGDEPDEKPAVPVPAQEPDFCERGLSGVVADAIEQAMRPITGPVTPRYPT